MNSGEHAPEVFNLLQLEQTATSFPNPNDSLKYTRNVTPLESRHLEFAPETAACQYEPELLESFNIDPWRGVKGHQEGHQEISEGPKSKNEITSH
jgi:hypothetical protein